MDKGRNMEQTLVIIKPDGVKRALIGRIIERYEVKNLKIRAMKFESATQEILEKHYEEHVGKAFYDDLLTFMKSGPIVVMALYGENAIELVRKINGATDFLKADSGSIRGQYAFCTTENLVHGSDSKASAEREIGIWFPELKK